MSCCPNCGSDRTASRRHLFLCMMESKIPLRGFEWYDRGVPQALPPKSLFVQLLLLVMVLTLPLLLLYFLQLLPDTNLYHGAAVGFAVMLFCLLLDVLLTHKRYRHWAAVSLCADCHNSFAHKTQNLSSN